MSGPPPPVKNSGNGTAPANTAFTVDLPAGGRLQLQSQDEVDLWDEAAEKYVHDFGLVKANDLMLLGAILSQGLAMYRAQQNLHDPKLCDAAQNQISKAAAEIRELEKALGIDKKTREAGGQHTTSDYIATLKRAAHAKGVHVVERVKKYEAFNMELRTRLRILTNADEEDRRYHNISPETICAWAEQELAALEAHDQQFAREKGKLWLGRI